MRVEDPRYRSPLHDAFFSAAEQRGGLPRNDDFNDWGRSQVGYGEFQVSQERGRRCDAATAYLTPEVRARDNLVIVPNARALKIELGEDTRSNGGPFSGSRGKAARGVIYAEGDTPDARVVEATLKPSSAGSSPPEVVLTAGAVHTPHLLMLSGIGDPRTLSDAGVPKCEVSLPGVGRNLQDHPACLSAFSLKPSAGAISITDHLLTRSGRLRASAVLNYALRRRGPLTSTG